ncbi:hypothetical protein GGI12_000045 [Dipsacomyces acuminosporus]|nr:hypothetical protein GGI12_000045 [Dipsacomyces acuminosporus]
MIGNMLRRSRDASGVAADSSYETTSPDTREAALDMLSSAVGALSSTVRSASGDGSSYSGNPHALSRKRSRDSRIYAANGEAIDDSSAHGDQASILPSTPPPAKRRGRPPRDYGEELGQAFSMFASENYLLAEQTIRERVGGGPDKAIPKPDVLRAVWDNWWLSSQMLKDKYLSRSRHEMAVNETHMLGLMIEYPLPDEGSAAQANLRQGHTHTQQRQQSRSPEPADPFNAFLREQIPLLREKVPDWSYDEILRRLKVNWNSMSPIDRERYSTGAGANAAANGGVGNRHLQHNTHPSATGASPYGHSGTGRAYSSRAKFHSAPRRAYVLFCKQERPILAQANPTWDLPTVNKELGRKWKSLSPEERQEFFDLERKESESRQTGVISPGTAVGGASGTYSTGTTPMGSHNTAGYANGQPITPTGSSGGARLSGGQAALPFIRPGGRSGTPGMGNPNKGPSKAYVYYSRLTRKSITAKHPDWDLATVNRELGRLWKAMSAEERQSWEKRSAAEADSAAGTPNRNESPTHGTSHSLTASIHAPSALSVNLSSIDGGDHSVASIPVTPASGTATPASNSIGAMEHRDYDGEGEAEDVDLQDEETEDEDIHHRASISKAGTGAPAPRGPPVSAYPFKYGPTAAPISLPKSPVSATLPGPPPTAKPAVMLSQGGDNSAANHGSVSASLAQAIASATPNPQQSQTPESQ